MTLFVPHSRRQFLAGTSRLAALSTLAALPLPALAASIQNDSRIPQTPIVDAGYAALYKVADGFYATISDTSKGFATICNGGFLVGKEAGLLLEGFGTPAGARFQFEAYHKVSELAAAGALLTHYHFDHTFGSAFYGASGIQLWGHADIPRRIMESYVALQGRDRDAFRAPFQNRIDSAKSDVARQHAQGDLNAYTIIFDLANKTSLALPNRPLDPARLPMHFDLGHLPIEIEHYPGHSGTDLIVRAPEHKIVYTGDLLFHKEFPVCFDEQCTISGWRNTLKTFASWDKDTLFIPGHGPICGQQGVQDLRDIFDDLSGQAEKMHKAGVPLADAMDQYVVPEKFKSLPIFAWGLCVGPAITKLYAEMGAK